MMVAAALRASAGTLYHIPGIKARIKKKKDAGCRWEEGG